MTTVTGNLHASTSLFHVPPFLFPSPPLPSPPLPLSFQVMGSCFLSLLESQAKLLSTASDIIAPLGAYKEVGKGLNESPSSSLVKEATVGWLAAGQVGSRGLN